MAPHQGAAAESTPSASGTHPVLTHALAPMVGGSYPDPRQLKAQLAQAFEDHLVTLRRERGTVCLPEDTHATIRRVHDVREGAAAYAEAFSALVKRADGVLAEELVEGVGDQDGIPNSGMKVPHNGSLIVLSPDYSTVRDIDLEQVLAVLVALVASEWEADEGSPSPAECPEGFAIECINRALAEVMAKTSPKVTGVEALAVKAGHRGDDGLAAAVRSAVGKPRKRFSKVKVEFRPDAS